MKNEPPTHVLGLAHPPIPVVRIGFIGLGNRGLLTLERYMLIKHVEIKALCEIRPGNLAKGQALLTKGGHPVATGYTGENGRLGKKSTGIGLYLSQMAAKKLGHTISVESIPGEGSSFKIDLSSYDLQVE